MEDSVKIKRTMNGLLTFLLKSYVIRKDFIAVCFFLRFVCLSLLPNLSLRFCFFLSVCLALYLLPLSYPFCFLLSVCRSLFPLCLNLFVSSCLSAALSSHSVLTFCFFLSVCRSLFPLCLNLFVSFPFICPLLSVPSLFYRFCFFLSAYRSLFPLCLNLFVSFCLSAALSSHSLLTFFFLLGCLSIDLSFFCHWCSLSLPVWLSVCLSLPLSFSASLSLSLPFFFVIASLSVFSLSLF